MIRIITGSAKNRNLKTPKFDKFRSVQEVAKGSLFSILGDKTTSAECLDLYAGSGNLGLEALSRGARWCDFVDDHKDSEKVILENIRALNFMENSEFHHKDAVKYVANTDKKYDLIFVDPFYDDVKHIFLMKNLEEILNENGIIAFFHGENLEINSIIKDTKLKIIDERKFGKSLITLLTKS